MTNGKFEKTVVSVDEAPRRIEQTDFGCLYGTTNFGTRLQVGEEQALNKRMVEAETLRMRWRLVASDPPPEDTQLLLYGSRHSLHDAQYPATTGSYIESLEVYCGAYDNSNCRGKTWNNRWGDRFYAPIYWMHLPKPPGHKE